MDACQREGQRPPKACSSTGMKPSRGGWSGPGCDVGGMACLCDTADTGASSSATLNARFNSCWIPIDHGSASGDVRPQYHQQPLLRKDASSAPRAQSIQQQPAPDIAPHALDALLSLEWLRPSCCVTRKNAHGQALCQAQANQHPAPVSLSRVYTPPAREASSAPGQLQALDWVTNGQITNWHLSATVVKGKTSLLFHVPVTAD